MTEHESKVFESILNLELGENDAEVRTVRHYFRKLLLTLWEEGESFNGKRPFGNSAWQYTIYTALIRAKVVNGKLDEDGYVQEMDEETADKIIKNLICYIFDSNLKSDDTVIISNKEYLTLKDLAWKYNELCK